MLGAKAQAKVPIEYITIVISSVRLRPMRSQSLPKTTPPIAQPTSRSAVISPVQ